VPEEEGKKNGPSKPHAVSRSGNPLDRLGLERSKEPTDEICLSERVNLAEYEPNPALRSVEKLARYGHVVGLEVGLP